MKKLVIALGVSLVFSGMAAAAKYGDETNRMESGAKFAERQTSSKFNSAPSPVQLAGDFTPVETAKCNAEAKDFNKLTAKAPPSLNASADKKAENKGWSAEKIGTVAGAVAGAVIAVPMIGAGIPIIACVVGVSVIVAAGAAAGYGAVQAAKQVAKRI